MRSRHPAAVDEIFEQTLKHKFRQTMGAELKFVWDISNGYQSGEGESSRFYTRKLRNDYDTIFDY
jgi:hypothetical protein